MRPGTVDSQHSIRYGDTTIAYEVRRSERREKTVQISVTGAGVLVLAPAATPDRELQAIVRKRAAWILTRSTEAALTAPPKRFISGETMPYLGRNLRMIVTPADIRSPRVRFDHWRFHIETPHRLTGQDRTDRIRNSFIEWYRTRAGRNLPERVQHWLPQIGTGAQPHTGTSPHIGTGAQPHTDTSPHIGTGAQPHTGTSPDIGTQPHTGTQSHTNVGTQPHTDVQPRVLIRDQRLRWGSCAPDGTLRFNWRVMMLPPALIDYVVLHELAHLTIRNHSPDFWNLLTTAMPDTQTRRRNLREAGRHLPL